MVDSESTTKEVINAELTDSELEQLGKGYGTVEIEGESVILRVTTENMGLSDRMESVRQAYHHSYDEARRKLD